ncbi:MAG TPA: hypothetical protein VM012_11510 [Flavitalea sp.]|nr:hypothetical protein [Flavitalea sp.]
MKKVLLLVFLGFASFFTGFSQSNATEGRVEFDKGQKIAAVVEVPYPPDVVESAIKDYMSKKGMKSDKWRDFIVYKGARVSDNNLEVSDLYFNVDRRNRKDKTSQVSLIVGRPGENVGLRTSDDRLKVEEGISLLNSMIGTMDSHGLEAEIAAQEEVVKKAEKKLKNLVEDQKDVEKRIKNLEDKLQENKDDQRKQEDELARQRSMLDAMKVRRRG